MARVSFIGTEIDRVKFRNVDWGDFEIYDGKLLLLKSSKKERKKFIKEEKRKLKKVLEILNDKIPNLNKNQRQPEVKEQEVEEMAEEINLREIIQMVFPEEKDEKSKDAETKLQTFLEKYKNEIKEILEKEDQELEKDILDHLNSDYLAKNNDLTLDNVLAVYRGLRENYDYYLRYDESGKFFVNEMKLKKRFAGPLEKIVLWTYELLALYGESYTRPIAWTLIIIPIFALLRTINFSLQGFISYISQLLYTSIPDPPTLDTLMDNLKTSTEIFFQLRYDDSPLTLIERLVSIPILGSLYIALRRKLERRIRH
jgi:vacuolar-type H+-ATPase subunit I/STV1